MKVFSVAVIGGGATGTSVFRDLSMRGISCCLIERGRLSSGTTVNSHQNLVGGMRYVIKDPQVAKECAEENRVLGNIAKHLISRKRNFFVGKLDKYTDEALSKAAELGVEFTEVDTRKALKEIPNLNKEIEIVVETADRNLDAAEFCKQSCMDAVKNGGEVLEETAIETIRYESTSFRIKSSNDIINCNFVVNATGAWANKIAQMVGVKLPLTYSQGTIAVQDTLSPRGIQCLRAPSDGDAYIVHGEYAWLGTTSTQIPSPDKAEPEQWADRYLKEKFSFAMRAVLDQKTIKLFAGVRPLIGETEIHNSRNVSRDFRIIESPMGLFSIIGGKLTTARFMAEKAVNMIAQRIGNSSLCMTSVTPIHLGNGN